MTAYKHTGWTYYRLHSNPWKLDRFPLTCEPGDRPTGRWVARNERGSIVLEVPRAGHVHAERVSRELSATRDAHGVRSWLLRTSQVESPEGTQIRLPIGGAL